MDAVRGSQQLLELPLCLLTEYRSQQEEGGGVVCRALRWNRAHDVSSLAGSS